MTTNWVISHHAAFRAHERHGCELDVEKFVPQPMGRQGLRLWLNGKHGILVLEKRGTDWSENVVVSALSAEQLDRFVMPNMPLVSAKAPVLEPTKTAKPAKSVPKAKLTNSIIADVLQAVTRSPGLLADRYHNVAGDTSLALRALRSLRKQGKVRRSKRRRWWPCTTPEK